MSNHPYLAVRRTVATAQQAIASAALMLSLLTLPLAHANEIDAPLSLPRCSADTAADGCIPTDEALEAAGATIGEIYVDNINIFDTRLPEEDNALFRFANWLHVKTRRETILQQLLVKPGDAFSTRLLRESERVLRANGYLHDAFIQPRTWHDGVVDLQILTQDVWTLKPGVSFGRKGGRNSSSVGIQETNLLGWGKDVGIDYKSGVDRTSKAFAFRDRQLAGTWWTLSAEYDDNSDGRAQKLTLERPFFSLDSRDAMGLTFRNERRVDSLYQQGQIVDQYAVVDRGATVYTGWSAGLRNGSALRWTVGVTSDELRYDALPSTVSTTLPPGRRLVYPWVGVAWLEDQYLATKNQDQIGKTEDVALGWNVQGRFGIASSSLGSDRNAGVFIASAAKGWQPTPAQTVLLNASAEGRLQGEGFSGTRTSLSTRYYFRASARNTFFAAASIDRGLRLDGDQQIQLGGDNGLRGYPLRYQSGNGRWLITAEQRTFTDWYPFRLFRLGGAIFYDMGRTWDGNAAGDSSRGLLRDAGLGLRIGNSRSALGTIVHVDAAFPLDGDSSIKRVQFIVEAKRSF